jgi:hypothetical protein
MIHFGAARVTRIFGCMSFIKDLLSQCLVMWNDYSIIEPYCPFIIHMKVANLWITLDQPSLYVRHTNILLLRGNDFPSQGWSDSHIEEGHIWRYSDDRFFFGQGHSWQIIAMCLAAQVIRNDIHLSRMIMNLQIIILDQLQPSSLAHVQIRLGEDIV